VRPTITHPPSGKPRKQPRRVDVKRKPTSVSSSYDAIARGLNGRPLRFATDCSGADAPLFALLNIAPRNGLEYVFASESCAKKRFELDRNWATHGTRPEHLFSDVLTRSEDTLDGLLGRVPLDLYVAGPPCPPFSALGKHGGEEDPRARVFEACVASILRARPTIFILENVEGFMFSKHSDFRDRLLARLRAPHAHLTYTVTVGLANATRFGSAASRPRCFVCGILEAALPPGVAPWIPVADCVEQCLASSILLPEDDPRVVVVLRGAGHARSPISVRTASPDNLLVDPREPHFFDSRASARFARVYHERLPCLLESRGEGPYCTSRRRTLCAREVARAQGFPETWLEPGSCGLAHSLMGNSMHVGTIATIMTCLLGQIARHDPDHMDAFPMNPRTPLHRSDRTHDNCGVCGSRHLTSPRVLNAQQEKELRLTDPSAVLNNREITLTTPSRLCIASETPPTKAEWSQDAEVAGSEKTMQPKSRLPKRSLDSADFGMASSEKRIRMTIPDRSNLACLWPSDTALGECGTSH
jgi:site-specific DNA-cytosine methylase